MTNLYDFSADDIDGKKVPLEKYKGKTLLIVNTASQCGFTPQYAGLEKLHRDLADRGFEVLGFPCNQFGHQEPGNSAEIAEFCNLNYQLSFPLFERIEVNGEHAHPLFRHLKQAAPGALGTEAIKWNFTKFLVDRSARVVARYAPATAPEKLAADIEALL